MATGVNWEILSLSATNLSSTTNTNVGASWRSVGGEATRGGRTELDRGFELVNGDTAGASAVETWIGCCDAAICSIVFSLSLRGPRVPWCLLNVQAIPAAEQPAHGVVLEHRTFLTLHASQARLAMLFARELDIAHCDGNVVSIEHPD